MAYILEAKIIGKAYGLAVGLRPPNSKNYSKIVMMAKPSSLI